MMSLLRYGSSISLFMFLVSSLVLDVPQHLQPNGFEVEPPPLLPDGLESLSDSTANSSQTSKSRKGNNHYRVRCSGDAYGHGLKYDSCIEAISSMTLSAPQRSFGDRGKGHFDINLPFRLQSSKFDPLA